METFANELNFDVEGYYGHHGVLHPAVPPGNLCNFLKIINKF